MLKQLASKQHISYLLSQLQVWSPIIASHVEYVLNWLETCLKLTERYVDLSSKAKQANPNALYI
jgi:hypothetical protein